jgi:predicted 2-oxoglutarate/Fe(II)-dependent dioxygenase YbiX
MQVHVQLEGMPPYVAGDALDYAAPLVFTIPALLTADECAELIAKAEAAGFDDAPITTPAGFVMRKDIRNNTRVMFDDRALAAALFERLRDAVPPRLCDRRPAGVNERMRVYRYEPDQYFAPHYDGCYQRNAHESSELTFMVYLNDDFTGGHTNFLHFGRTIAPRTGDALLFQHAVLHEGATVESGRKYALRSDVMYAD